METTLEGGLSHAGGRRGLLCGEALDVAEHDRRAPVRRKLRERAPQDRLELAIEHARLRTQMRFLGDRGDRVLPLKWRLDTRELVPREPSLRLVEGNAIEPGGQLRARLEPRKSTPR